MRLTGPAVQRIASTSLVVVRWMRRSRVPAKHGNHQYYKGATVWVALTYGRDGGRLDGELCRMYRRQARESLDC